MSIHQPLVRRAENDQLPLQGLRAICELRSELDELQAIHIAAARDKGASWAEIAEALGISRQALQQKMRSANQRTLRLKDEIHLDKDSQESTAAPLSPGTH